MKWLLISALVLVALVGAAIVWTEVTMAGVEEPRYQVLRSDGAVELRDYPPMLLASTTVSGAGRDARGDGFRVLADFIFGNNRAGDKVAMTAPVEEASQKIAMTAPVEENADGSGATVITFIMPDEYTADTLPVPVNEAVDIETRPAERIAAIRFSGIAGTKEMEAKEAELRAWLSREGVEPAGDARYARYDPPWRLPFQRRNEVLIPVRNGG